MEPADLEKTVCFFTLVPPQVPLPVEVVLDWA